VTAWVVHNAGGVLPQQDRRGEQEADSADREQGRPCGTRPGFKPGKLIGEIPSVSGSGETPGATVTGGT